MLVEQPEDFVVEELLDITGSPGPYLYVKVKKKNMNTLDVVKFFCSTLKIPRRYVSYAGSKDKFAVTTQHFSLLHVSEERINKLHHPNLELTPLTTRDKPISLGTLNGNSFKIRVSKKPPKINFLVNYFGEQRFSENNAEIGKAILKKDFKKACSLIDHNETQKHLTFYPNDFVGALQTLDKKLLSLYIHAFQSFVWNETSKRYLKNKYKDAFEFQGFFFVNEIKQQMHIPLIAFDTEFQDPLVERFCLEVLKEQTITLDDFIIRTFPEIMPVTTLRPLFVNVTDFKTDNNNIQFTLPKGSYATTFLKQLEAFDH